MIILINTKNRTIREFRNHKEKKQDIIERWAIRMDLMTDILASLALRAFWRNDQQKMDFINSIADDAKMEVRAKCKH